LVGGITGALIPAIRELITELDEVPTAQAHAQSATDRASAAFLAQASAAHRASASLDDFVRSLSVGGLRDRGRELEATITSVADELATLEETGGQFFDEGTIRGERIRLSARLERLQRESAEIQSQIEQNTGRRRQSGGSGTGLSDREQQQYDLQAAMFTAQADAEREEHERVLRRLDEEYEANERLIQAKMRWQEELDEADKRSQQEERERALAGLEAYETELRRQEDLAAAHQQVVTENVQSTMGSVIGSMTEVLGQLAQGNATVEESAKLMLAAFLQAMSQRAQIEALAEVARAISSYPDVAGIAIHAAGALAWGAVAVATGVGAGAISSDVSKAQAARKEAEKPAAPAKSSGSGGSGGQTIVVNFNSPVVTAQTEAGLGVSIRNTIGVSQRRFPSAA
jgi:hypothetical protein